MKKLSEVFETDKYVFYGDNLVDEDYVLNWIENGNPDEESTETEKVIPEFNEAIRWNLEITLEDFVNYLHEEYMSKIEDSNEWEEDVLRDLKQYLPELDKMGKLINKILENHPVYYTGEPIISDMFDNHSAKE